MQVTKQMIDHLIDRINVEAGTPLEPRTNQDGKIRANIGCYHYSKQLGGYHLEQIVNEGGGVRSVLRCGRVPKKEFYNVLMAFLEEVKTQNKG